MTTTQMDTGPYRVTHGWNRYEDFGNLADALTYMADRLRQPTSDPHTRLVSLLDARAETKAREGYFPTIISDDRPVTS